MQKKKKCNFHILIIGPTLKKSAKGKLLDCFNNRRREYKKAGLITPLKQTKSSPKSPLLLAVTKPTLNTGMYFYFIQKLNRYLLLLYYFFNRH